MNSYFIKLIILTVFSTTTSYGVLPSVFSNIESRLNEIEIVQEGAVSLDELKKVTVDQNIDVEISYENYYKAKQEVNIARAQYNPLTTGHALGLALGMNYLWEAVATEAILSIPMKAYNVRSQKYVSKAQYYNYQQMQETIKNDMVHLYYDILIHKMILQTIDLEAELITSFYGNSLDQDTFGGDPEEVLERSSQTLAMNKRLLLLGIERLDIEMLYIKELEAFRNLLAITFNTRIDELSPVASTLDLDKVKSIDVNELKNDALYKNPQFLAFANLTAASKAGVKSVKWSIITFGGLNFSYGKRVKLSKTSYQQAQLRENSEARKVRVGLIGSYNKLLSSTKISSYHTSNFNQTMALYNEVVDNNKYGLVSDESAMRVSIELLRDYRDHALAKYKSLSSLDDFNNASKAEISIEDYSSSMSSNAESPYVLRGSGGSLTVEN